MFEALITKVLNKVLGDFIENLQASQLDISLLKGDVNLTNMKLKSDMFASLPVPFALVFGQIGRIHIRIPPLWKLHTESLVIEISDIMAIIRPKHVKEWSEEVEIKEYKLKQRKRLEQQEIIENDGRQAMEMLMQQQSSSQEQDGASPQSQESKIDQLVNKIIDNIEISIKDVYVRYEDAYSSPHSGKFAVGILLKELVTHTTGKDWTDKIMQQTSQDITYKLLRLTNFSIFLDFSQDGKKDVVHSIDINKIDWDNNAFKEVIQNEFRIPHKYILDYFSMEARLQLNKKPEKNKQPKFDIDVILGGQFFQSEDNGISLMIHQPQIVRITKLIEYIGFFGDFQSGATSSYENKPLTQEIANTYIELYTQYKEISNTAQSIQMPLKFNECFIGKQVSSKVLLSQLKNQIEELEDQYPADKIISLRDFAKKVLDQRQNEWSSIQMLNREIQERRGQMTKWGGIFSSRDEELEKDRKIHQYKQEIEKKLNQKILSQKAELDLELTRLTDELSQNTSALVAHPQISSQSEEHSVDFDYLKLNIAVQIPTFKLGIINEHNQPLVEISIVEQQSYIQMNSEFSRMEFSMKALIIKDLWTKACPEYANIIETRDIENEGEVSPEMGMEEIELEIPADREKLALTIVIESQSNEEIPTKIDISSERTLLIIPIFPLINEVIRTLSNAFKSEEIDMNYYHEAATEKALEFMNRGKQLIQNIKKGDYEHSALNLSVHLFAPMILVPEDNFDIKKPCILIDSGIISLKSILIPPEHFRGKNFKLVTKASLLYDRYECGFKEFQINLLPNGVKAGMSSIYRGCGSQVIKKLNIHLEFLSCLEPMHPLFPTLEMVFIVQNFEILASFQAFYTIMRVQERFVDTILNDEEQIFQKPQQHHDKQEKKIDDDSWEKYREERKKTMKSLEERSSKIGGSDLQRLNSLIQEEKKSVQLGGRQNEAREEGNDTSFKMYFSVEKFQVMIYHDVPSEIFKNQTTMEGLFNILMLNLGVEIDLDRKNDKYINVNVFKLLIEDTHKKSNIVNQFRMILSNEVPDLPEQLLGRRHKYLDIGIMKKCLISKIEAEQIANQYILNELRPQFNIGEIEHQVDVRITLLKKQYEKIIKVSVSDIKLIFTLPTASKIIQILKELDRTLDLIDEAKLKDRKAKLQIYEFVLQQLGKNKKLPNREQDYLMRIFSNFANDNKLDPRVHQSEFKEGLYRLKTIWDMRKLQKDEDLRHKNKDPRNSFGNKQPKQSFSETLQEMKEIVKTKLRVTASLKQLQVWIPLYAESENSQLLQLSLMSEFSMVRNSVEEHTINVELNEIVDEDLHESRNQMGFSMSQITVQIINCKELIQIISPRKSMRKYSRSSISEEEISESSEDFYPLMTSFRNLQMIIPPTKVSLKMQSHTHFKPEEKEKSEMKIRVDPLSIQIGFKHIDFFNIILMQINSTLGFFEDEEEGGGTQIGTNKMGSPRKSVSPTKIKEEIKESENNLQAALKMEKKTEKKPKYGKYDPLKQDNRSPKDLTDIQIHLDSLTLSLNDDSSKQHIPLFYAELKNILSSLRIAQYNDDAGIFILKKLGLWQNLNLKDKPYIEMSAQMYIQMSYYNPRSLAFEPLLEKWDCVLKILQTAPYAQQKIKFSSENTFNLNLTFGMALTLRKIMNRIEQSFKQAELMKKVEGGHASSAEEFEFTANLRRKMLQDQTIDQEEEQKNQFRMQDFEPGFIFQNFVGLDIKFALHDEFSDDSLESSIFNVEYDFRRQSISQKNQGERNKLMYFSLEANPSQYLYQSYKELSSLQIDALTLKSGGLQVEQLEEDPLRMDFKFHGLSKIQAVPIENIGVFSYEVKVVDLFPSMYPQKKQSIFRSPLRSGSEQSMTCGIIVNISMDGTQKRVTFESQVLMRNNTRNKIRVYVKNALQIDQDVRQDQIREIEPDEQFKIPLNWLVTDTKVSMFLSTSYGSQLLFKNLLKTFTSNKDYARINSKHSRIIKISNNHFLSLNIQAYSCQPKSTSLQNPPQFLISFNYPLLISNYNFQSLQVNSQSYIDERPFALIGPKETAYIDSLDMIPSHMNLEWILFDGSDQKYIMYTQHFDPEARSMQQDGTLEKFKNIALKKKIKLSMEVRKIKQTENCDGNLEYENFETREKIMDYSSSYQVMVYPKYMLINKTSVQLQFEEQIFEPFSNNYLNVQNDKAAFKAPGYKYSESLNLNTVGMSGILALDIDNQSEVTLDRLLTGQEYFPKRLDYGLSISTASAPFNKTLVISITPRYLLINQLNTPIVIKQKNRQGQIIVRGQQSMQYFFENKKERFVMIREPNQDESNGQRVDGEIANDESNYWSTPFSIDDMEDFQVSYPQTDHLLSFAREEQKQQPLWYEANPKNDYQRFVRVIIKTQNEATIQVVFTNPHSPEFEIHNKSSYDLQFGQVEAETLLKQIQKLKLQQGNVEELVVGHKLFPLPHSSQIPFTWLQRLQSKRLLGLRIGHNQLIEIDLEKAMRQTEFIAKEGDVKIIAEVKVAGNSKKLVISNLSAKNLNSIEEGRIGSQYLITLLKKLMWHKKSIKLKLKAIGLSFIDESPQELLYFTLHGLKVSFYQWLEAQNSDDHSSNIIDPLGFDLNSKLRGSLKHIQLDNMISQTMPVILIPSKPLSKNEKDSHRMLEERIQRQMDEEIKEGDCEEGKTQDNDPPFIQFIVSYAENKNDFRLRTLQFAMQEFIFQIDTSIFNNNLKFVMELIDTFSVSSQNKVIKASQENFERSKNIKREIVCEDLNAAQLNFQSVEIESEKSKLANKMYIELIHLGAIKAIITFRLEKRAVEIDVADPAKGFGVLNIFYTVFGAFANISHSPLSFKELILIDTFASQDSLINQLLMNYVRQAILQFYKLIASSDIIGNPLGLVNKLGTGVYELVSEPSKGLLKGTDEFVGGVGKGVQSLVSNVISGSFESMSKITGSLYTVVKNVSGEKNAQIRRSEHIGEGIYYGVKGGVKELVYGVTGIVTKPIQKTREEGAKGFFKGLGSGLVGAIAAPVTATLRAGTSVTQGVAASANSLGMIGKKIVDTSSIQVRFRPPRYISAKGVIQEYDEDLALVRQILVTKYSGIYAGDSIKFYSLLPYTKKNGVIANSDSSSSMIIITETMFLYFRLDTSDKKRGQAHRIFKSRLRKIQSCELHKVQIQGGGGRKRNQAQSLYNIVLVCYSQVKGKKKLTLVGQEYGKFEQIYKLLSVLPFCEAVNKVKKLRNSKLLVDNKQGGGLSLF